MKKHTPTPKSYRPLAIKIAITIILILAVVKVATLLQKPIPSEGTCQKFYNCSVQQGCSNKADEDKMSELFCDHNETGWHINNTSAANPVLRAMYAV